MPTRVAARLAPLTFLPTILHLITSLNLESFHPHRLELCPTHTMSAASQVVGRCASIAVSRSTFRSRDRTIAYLSASACTRLTGLFVCLFEPEFNPLL